MLSRASMGNLCSEMNQIEWLNLKDDEFNFKPRLGTLGTWGLVALG